MNLKLIWTCLKLAAVIVWCLICHPSRAALIDRQNGKTDHLRRSRPGIFGKGQK